MDISTSYNTGYINLVTINNPTPIMQWTPFMLGEYSAANPLDGEINLANSYIKIGNDRRDNNQVIINDMRTHFTI